MTGLGTATGGRCDDELWGAEVVESREELEPGEMGEGGSLLSNTLSAALPVKKRETSKGV